MLNLQDKKEKGCHWMKETCGNDENVFKQT